MCWLFCCTVVVYSYKSDLEGALHGRFIDTILLICFVFAYGANLVIFQTKLFGCKWPCDVTIKGFFFRKQVHPVKDTE